MTTITAPRPPATTTTGTTTVTEPQRWLDERRIAGIGAIGFASIVLITNGVLASFPGHDASAAEITQYFTDHRTAALMSTAGFAFGAPFLLGFAAAFYGRLKAAGQAADLVWARLGAIGAFLILPMFAAVVTNRLVLLAGGDEIIGTPEIVTLLWRLESAAFLLNTLSLSIAVLGFGLAGARAGLLPRWFAKVAPVGAVFGVLGSATAVSGLEGGPTIVGGLLAFLTWMALLLIAGTRQLRNR
jgi:hypothetical protein